MRDEQLPPSHKEIMWATHRALCAHGYGNLTLRKIAAESSKSHSLLTYHYDTKDNLIEAYLNFLVDLLEDVVERSNSAHPLDRLNEFLDYFSVGSEVFPESLQIAFLEFQMIALRDENFRETLAEHNRNTFELVSDIIDDGINQGVFRPSTDSDAFAKLVLLSVMGASEQEITAGEAGLTESVRKTLDSEVFPKVLLTSSSATPSERS